MFGFRGAIGISSYVEEGVRGRIKSSELKPFIHVCNKSCLMLHMKGFGSDLPHTSRQREN